MEAQKLRQCALDRSPSVVSELANMCSSEYIKIAQKLAQVAEGNYNDVLGILNKATLPEGAFFVIEQGELSRLYVSNPGVKTSPSWSPFYKWKRPNRARSKSHESVFDVLHFEDSCMGAWQAFLMHQSWHYLLPVYRHGFRYRRLYIYSEEDLKWKDDHTEPEDDNSIPSLVEDWKTVGLKYAIQYHLNEAVDFAPEVFSVNGRYYVSCCYWTAWGGLIREHKELVLKEGKLDEFISFKDETIWPYDCGFVF